MQITESFLDRPTDDLSNLTSTWLVKMLSMQNEIFSYADSYSTLFVNFLDLSIHLVYTW